MLREGNQGNLTAIFHSEGKTAVKCHWPFLIYLVLFMAGTNLWLVLQGILMAEAPGAHKRGDTGPGKHL